jgi:hypothetical protein
MRKDPSSPSQIGFTTHEADVDLPVTWRFPQQQGEAALRLSPRRESPRAVDRECFRDALLAAGSGEWIDADQKHVSSVNLEHGTLS